MDGINPWYRRIEVDALRQEKPSLLTIREAGNLVGRDNSLIENWKKTGRLKPVSGPIIDGSTRYLCSREDVEKTARTIRARCRSWTLMLCLRYMNEAQVWTRS
jgi:hypothetical protein